MSRSIAILLLTLFLFPLVGHVVFFKFRQYQVRHEFKEKLEHSIPKAELTLIKIPRHWLRLSPSHFQQLERNEFRLYGTMYDIINREAYGDTLWYYCLADAEETLLFARLDDWVQAQSQSDPFQSGQNLQWDRLVDSLFQISISNPSIAFYRPLSSAWPPYRFAPVNWKVEAIDPPPEPFA